MDLFKFKTDEGVGWIKLNYKVMTEAEFKKVRAAARAGNLTLVTPQIPDMVIGGQRLQEP